MESAAQTWRNRFNSLVKIWSESQGQKKKRLWNITCELDDRQKALRELYWRIKEQQKKTFIEGQHERINLKCANFACRYKPDSVVVSVYLKDYKDGVHKCCNCGDFLRMVEDLGGVAWIV